MSEKIADIYAEMEAKAKSCQRTWGMGFPVISLTLLGPYLRRIVDAARNTNPDSAVTEP